MREGRSKDAFVALGIMIWGLGRAYLYVLYQLNSSTSSHRIKLLNMASFPYAWSVKTLGLFDLSFRVRALEQKKKSDRVQRGDGEREE